MPLSHAVFDDSSSRCAPDVCVLAVLGDALHRVAVLGGREGMPRSLGSVYGGSVTRFLGGALRGVVSRVIATAGVLAENNGIAVSRDGATLLLSDFSGGSHAIHAFNVMDGSRRRVVGSVGDGPLQFREPFQVSVAPDDFVFVADWGNDRVQVLTPDLDFHGFVGVGVLREPRGVCANADVVVVSEYGTGRISVFSRGDGALLRRFGSYGRGDGQLVSPFGLCFLSSDRHVAVAEYAAHRVSVFSVDGEFIRHVGFGALVHPYGVVCSAFDDLVVTSPSEDSVVLIDAGGKLVKTLVSRGRSYQYSAGAAIHGTTVFVQCRDRCLLLE